MTTPDAASGVILAGGASRRMGRDKLRLNVGGKPLVQRAHGSLAKRCDEILLVTSSSTPEQENYGLAARPIKDLRPGQRGPLAGLEAALAAARHDRVFVAAGDMPLVPESLVNFLLESLSETGTRVAVPKYGGRLHPLCAAYRREVLVELSFTLNLGVRSVHEFLGSIEGVWHVEAELLLHGDPGLYLMNVNAPEDLYRARNELPET